MGLPAVTFKEFLRNPIMALLFMSLMSIGYLYYENKSTLTRQIEDLQEEVRVLKEEYRELNSKFINTIRDLGK